MTVTIDRKIYDLLDEAKSDGVDIHDKEELLDWVYEEATMQRADVDTWLQTNGGIEKYPRGLEEGFRGADYYNIVTYGSLAIGEQPGWMKLASRLNEFGDVSPVLFTNDYKCQTWMWHAVHYHPETGEPIGGGIYPRLTAEEIVEHFLGGNDDLYVILDPDPDGGGKTVHIKDLMGSETEVLTA